MEIKYIDLTLADYTIYRIYKDNILEFNLETKEDKVDNTLFSDENDRFLVTLLDSMLLVIDNIHQMINIDGEKEFDKDDTSICYISIIYEEDSQFDCYVDMTDEDYNRKQLNCLKEDNLYITIEDN